MGKIVAVIGASIHTERYSNRAIKLLKTKGHTVIAVNPLYNEIEGLHSYKSLQDYKETIDTITVYVNPATAMTYIDDIISVKPERVILNPGTENPHLEKRLKEAGINVFPACTIVMLNLDQF